MNISYDFNDIYENESHIEHIGMPRRSGRYPWGSGENPFQHESWYKHPGDFLDFIKQARKEKYEYTDEDGVLYTGDNAIAKVLRISTTDLRSQIGIAHLANTILRTTFHPISIDSFQPIFIIGMARHVKIQTREINRDKVLII